MTVRWPGRSHSRQMSFEWLLCCSQDTVLLKAMTQLAFRPKKPRDFLYAISSRVQTKLALRLKVNYGMDKIYYVMRVYGVT